jgi:tetratricopeptide (TPR) repeat protein
MALSLDLADWRHRSNEFGALLEYNGPDGESLVVMEYMPPNADRTAWQQLQRLWLDFPVHPHLLDAIECNGDRLLLRYAAFDWAWHLVEREPDIRLARARLACWGFQLADVLRTVASDRADHELALLTNPQPMLDLESELRVAFLPVHSEIKGDERGLVLAAGRAITAMSARLTIGVIPEIDAITRRCLLEPHERYPSLADVAAAFDAVAGTGRIRRRAKLHSWNLVEAGIGRLALDADRSLGEFASALDYVPGEHAITLEIDRSTSVVVESPESVRDALYDPSAFRDWTTREWLDVEPVARELERERRFADALLLYRYVDPDTVDIACLCTAIARCHLELGETGHAVDYASRAIAHTRTPAAYLIGVRALLLRKQRNDALALATAWLEYAPIDALAHYSCGRCLLALERHAEAMARFDRALGLQPGLIAAMMLRFEAARALARLRVSVGEQHQTAPPGHLVEPSNLLARGQAREAIAILEGAEHAADAVARLLLGACLVAEQRFEDALAVFEHVLTLDETHRVAVELSSGYALLALGRGADALERFERLDDSDAVEGRARALELLGRDEEARIEHERSIAIASRRATLRTRL